MLITSRGVDEKTPCCSWLEIPRQMHCTVWCVILRPSVLSPLVCCLLALSACNFCISSFPDFLSLASSFDLFCFPQRELKQNWSRIQERTILLSVLGIILRVIRIRIQCLHYKPVSNHFCSYTSTVVWNFKELLRKKLRFTWGWAEIKYIDNILQILNWVGWPELFSPSLLHTVCVL